MRGLLSLDDIFEARIGTSPKERGTKQTVRIKIEIVTDIERAAKSDDLADTVDLDSLRKAIADVLGEEYNLIERLASDLSGKILDMDKRVESVAVKITKQKTHTGIKVERGR